MIQITEVVDAWIRILDSDLIAFVVSCSILLSYYFSLERRARQTPDASVHALNARVRKKWIDMIFSKSNSEILAVQTLRNSVMAANFMASTSILLMMGALNISEKIGQWSLQRGSTSPPDSLLEDVWKIKLGLLLFDFSIAFFCFSMAIRFYNHVGYMINIDAGSEHPSDLRQQSYVYLNRAGRYYTFGMRAFFLSLPIILWFFGPYSLIISTFAMMFGLSLLDRVPK